MIGFKEMIGRKTLLGIIGILSIANAFAQPKEELYRLQQKYPDQSVVYTSVNEQIDIAVVNGSLDIKMKIDKESMLLDDRAALYSESRVSYSSLIYLTDIKAATLYPGDKRYKEIKVDEFKDRDKFNDSYIFHDDVKEKKFSYPELVKGAKRTLSMYYEMRDPYLLSSYQLPEYYPVENSTLKIVCPAEVEIGYKIFNADSVNISYETRTEKGKVIHEWKTKNIKKIDDEGGGPGHLYYTPHIVYFIKSYTANGQKQKILGSVDDLHNYYSKLVMGINKDTYQPLKKVVDSLTVGAKGDSDKIKSIFYWVKDNIKYIAFESGYEGFIPREAKDIFEKRYGDCKDMASILTEMMKYAGITSYLTWIGSRELPYSYADNPTSGSDNHMIASTKLNGKYLFLDATSTNTPFGYPSAFTQGKESIVHLSDTKYEVVKVPEISDSLNVNRDSVFIEIDKNLRIAGSGVGTYTGFERDEILELLDDKSKEEKLTTLKSYYQKGTNKFFLEGYEESDATDRDKPFSIQYKFNLSDYVLQSDNELFINLNLERIYDRSALEKDRKLDVEYDYKQQINNTIALKIPDGYTVSYLPPNDSLDTDLFGFKLTYEQTSNTVMLKTVVRLKTLMLQRKNFAKWNDFIDRLRKNYTESVALKLK